MEIKTSNLTDAALAYAVGAADKRIMRNGIGGSIEVRCRTEDGEELPDGWDMWILWYPQASWSQAGPIIEREKIELIHYGSMGYKGAWKAQIGQDIHYIDQSPGEAIHGQTPLIAAMRCFVSSRLGDEVDVPDELLGD